MHVNCSLDVDWKHRVVAGSASIANLMLSLSLWPVMRKMRTPHGSRAFFVWLLFSMNLFSGSGYWFASGAFGVGDWATVIRDWRPVLLYRAGLFVLGAAALTLSVVWVLVEFGRLLDKTEQKPIGHAQNICMTVYFASFATMLLVGLAQPGGAFSPAPMMAMFAVLGAYSPYLWMMQWFRAGFFKLQGSSALVVHRSYGSTVLAVALIVVAVAATIVGSGNA